MSKYIYDNFLKRDVTSIFEPQTLGHTYSDKESQVITKSNFDKLANGIKEFIQEYFSKNFDIGIENYQFLKLPIKEAEKKQEILCFQVMESKIKKNISLHRQYNIYSDEKLEKALKSLENGEVPKEVAHKNQINYNYLKKLWRNRRLGFDLRTPR